MKYDCQVYKNGSWIKYYLAWIKTGDWFRLGKDLDTYIANKDAWVDEEGAHVDADWHRRNPGEKIKKEF